MSNISKIIGKNIKNLLSENNCSVLQLSKIIGLSRPTIKKIIEGSTIIDSGKLLIISKYFNKPFEYFLEEEHDGLSFLFRANNPKENCNNYDKNFIESKMKKVSEIYKLVDENISFIPVQYNLNLKQHDIKSLNDNIEKTLESIAIKEREYLSIGECVGTDLIKCFENKGIRIIFDDMDNNQIFGVSAFNEEDGCFIFINDNKSISEERKIFSIVHEYAHLLFNRSLYSNSTVCTQYSNYKTDINEKIANSFAGYFLITCDSLKKYDYFLKPPIPWKILFEIKNELKVSIQSLIMALHKYKYINSTEKNTAFKKLYLSGYKLKEPEPMNYIQKNTKIYNMVKNLYIRDEIGINKTAELLGIKNIDARRITAKWVSDEEKLQSFI
ncbi:helix-turn-helix domain-containing protein [Clostridium sp. BJN0013]|uniref:helix-turn-helix domain-containing protein n=1 Tax=Clostridium sp. BJN0013 TaxID=3236840 RepID=UPI0034C66798